MRRKTKARKAWKAENKTTAKTKANMAAQSKFLTLTQDVMHLICEYLEPHDVLQLMRTNSTFNAYERSLILHHDMVGIEKRALSWACSKGNIDFARKCLELGYDPNFTTSGTSHHLGSTLKIPAPHFPPYQGHDLSRNNPFAVYIPFSILAQAIMADRPAMVSLLHQYGGRFSGIDLHPINEDERRSVPITPFHLVRSTAMLETILRLDPDLPVDETRWTVNEPILNWIILRGASSGTVRLLLEAGADPDGARLNSPQPELSTPYFRHTFLWPLEAAVFQLDVEMVRLLLNWGALFKNKTRDGDGHTHLHCALSHYLFQAPETYDRSIQILEACTNHGLDLNRKFRCCSRYGFSNRRSTLLHEALSSNVETEIFLKSLIDAGADSNTRIFCYRDGREKDAVLWILEEIAMYALERTQLTVPEIPDLCRKLRVLVETRSIEATRGMLIDYAISTVNMAQLEIVLHVIHRVIGRFTWGLEALPRLLERGRSLRGDLYYLRNCVFFLIRAGAPVYESINEKSALHKACMLPMESPMDTEDTDLKGYYSEYHSQTSLDELLSRMGNFAKRHENAMAIMIGLLWNGADPTPEDKEGRRPYWYAEATGGSMSNLLIHR
ncbi:hypothetical protein Ct61P_11882 [Colletotrichum tofieldiae]|nr:hypothetical protein Ct61P_11882 [Colletotrichum tofieldiae]